MKQMLVGALFVFAILVTGQGVARAQAGDRFFLDIRLVNVGPHADLVLQHCIPSAKIGPDGFLLSDSDMPVFFSLVAF